MHRSSEEIDADIASQSKACGSCGVRKKFVEFNNTKRTRDGVSSICKPCKAEATTARIARHRAANGVIVRPKKTKKEVEEFWESVDVDLFTDMWYNLVEFENVQSIADALGTGGHVVIRRAKVLGLCSRPSSCGSDSPGCTRLRFRTSGGYAVVKVGPKHKFIGMSASLNGKHRGILEHRLVMAIELGRPLEDNETVHHRNGVRDDNRLENLEHRWGQHGSGADYDATAGRVAEQADEIEELRAEVERLRSMLGEVAA